jgi:hypothetical protein
MTAVLRFLTHGEGKSAGKTTGGSDLGFGELAFRLAGCCLRGHQFTQPMPVPLQVLHAITFNCSLKYNPNQTLIQTT